MPTRAIVLVAAIGVLAVGAAAAPAAVQLDLIGTFDNPVYVTAPPRDGSRLLVAERAGTVRLLIGGARQATPFLDLRDRVQCCEGERGLGSIAFAPDYTTSGLLYAYYTARNPVGAMTVSEFRRSAADPNVADPASERILAQVPHSAFSNHNGGQVQFGPDGLLYAGTGDGGGGGDPDGNAQNPGSPLGKLLRIDPRTAATEVYAAGVRNPWRF
ncbi:MAG: PQQ-dependent sugar dehydrogenase, partial [Actinomycetota bacterium]|nr:PQQ-dependent sugar dehydrogenase [Actinomycetota bacterium]